MSSMRSGRVSFLHFRGPHAYIPSYHLDCQQPLLSAAPTYPKVVAGHNDTTNRHLHVSPRSHET